MKRVLDMKGYGAQFKKLREGKGMTLRETAKGIVSYQFLSNFENRHSNISLYNFVELLDRLHVSFNEFFIQGDESLIIYYLNLVLKQHVWDRATIALSKSDLLKYGRKNIRRQEKKNTCICRSSWNLKKEVLQLFLMNTSRS